MRLLPLLKKKMKENRKIQSSKEVYIARCFCYLLKELKEPVYRSRFIETLTGKNTTSFLEVNRELIGCLRDLTYAELKQIIYYYVSLGYINFIKKGKKILIFRTDLTPELCSETKHLNHNLFTMPIDEEAFINNHLIIEEVKQKEQKKNQPSEVINYNEDLYKLLLKKRYQISKEKHVPQYIVMTNQTLKLIAEAKPDTKEKMLMIYGMGEIRFEKYGHYFLEITREFLKNNENITNELTHTNSFESVFSGNEFISKSKLEKFYELFNENKLEVTSENFQYLNSFDKLNTYREFYNKYYIERKLIEEKDYLDHILDRVDSNITLDKNQREVVLRDEDYTLVVAGAGAGKTTTVAAKVKYLVDKKHVDPNKILIVSYTNDAVNELKDRINKHLNIPAIISTFHKVGYAILRKSNDEPMKIAHEGMVFNIIRDYLKQQLSKKPDDLRLLVLFFGYYIDAPISDDSLDAFINHFQRNDFTTLKTNLRDATERLIDENAAKKHSILNEVMRSLEEVQIANYLFLHYVDYEYESAYPYHMEGSDKIYTPDFTIRYKDKVIYLEHFGISEDGNHTRYSDEELERYKQNINDKILLHKKRETKLIYTFSSYKDGRSLLRHLEEHLEKEGIELVERPLKEVYDIIVNDESNKYLLKLVFLIKDFISSFKINGYTENDFENLAQKTDNVRSKLFLRICKPIYLHYQQYLSENQLIDFEDMINQSARLLSNKDFINEIPDFEYAIIDEYQDISQQRFDLTKAIAELTKAKIIAVGDDWQSIFAFAGSRIDLFLKFKDLMGYADYLTIDYTYRNAQEVIDIAGDFIQKNDSQLKKHLKSPKSIKSPITLYEYSDLTSKNEKKGYVGIIHEKAVLLEKIISEIISQYGINKSIALLGRYNFEEEQLSRTDLFYLDSKDRIHSNKFPKAKLLFSTIHRAKGLGFDNVILLNGSDEIFGFPSQIQMDPILRLVKYDDKSISYAEERRLLYVALTRTKNQVHILYPKTKPSSFVLELAKDYKLVNHPREILQKIPLQDRKDKLCPICGYPLQLKHNKNYGLKLYICSNEPEVCSYMTNNLRSGKESISKCPECLTGYLIVKYSKNTGDHFFGCTNYKDGKGCKYTKPISTDINQDLNIIK